MPTKYTTHTPPPSPLIPWVGPLMALFCSYGVRSLSWQQARLKRHISYSSWWVEVNCHLTVFLSPDGHDQSNRSKTGPNTHIQHTDGCSYRDNGKTHVPRPKGEAGIILEADKGRAVTFWASNIQTYVNFMAWTHARFIDELCLSRKGPPSPPTFVSRL